MAYSFYERIKFRQHEYGDGSIGSLIPIQEALDRGANEVDVIILRPNEITVENEFVQNGLDLAMKVFDFRLHQIGVNDITIGELKSRNTRVAINFYYASRVFTENPLIFEPEQMTALWQEGFDCAKESNPVCCIVKNSEIVKIEL